MSEGNSSERQLLDLERELRESLRRGYLFGNFDEPLWLGEGQQRR